MWLFYAHIRIFSSDLSDKHSEYSDLRILNFLWLFLQLHSEEWLSHTSIQCELAFTKKKNIFILRAKLMAQRYSWHSPFKAQPPNLCYCSSVFIFYIFHSTTKLCTNSLIKKQKVMFYFTSKFERENVVSKQYLRHLELFSLILIKNKCSLRT